MDKDNTILYKICEELGVEMGQFFFDSDGTKYKFEENRGLVINDDNLMRVWRKANEEQWLKVLTRDNILIKTISPTFEEVEQGDLVCGRGKHSADIRIVEGIVKNEGKNNNVLLVNGRYDLFYEGENLDIFNSEWRLLCKKENLID